MLLQFFDSFFKRLRHGSNLAEAIRHFHHENGSEFNIEREKSQDARNVYLKTVCDYARLNAARAKLLRPDQPLRSYLWSSWGESLEEPSRRPAWLRVDRLLGEHGIPKERSGRKARELN